MAYNKPLPTPKPWSEPFWKATTDERLLIQTCADCETKIAYPKRYCPECSGTDFDWVEATGLGTVYTFSTVYDYPPSAFADDTPYTPAIIELKEGVRLMSIIDATPSEIKCGLSVEVGCDPVSDSVWLPIFHPKK